MELLFIIAIAALVFFAGYLLGNHDKTYASRQDYEMIKDLQKIPMKVSYSQAVENEFQKHLKEGNFPPPSKHFNAGCE